MKLTGSPIHLKLTSGGIHGKTGRVWLNGEEITGRVRRVEVDWACDNVNMAVIHLYADSIQIDGTTYAAVESGS